MTTQKASQLFEDIIQQSRKLKVPGLDIEAVLQGRRKDVEALLDVGRIGKQSAESIASNQVGLNSNNGIGILVSIAQSGALAQSLTVTANTVFYNSGDGISLANFAENVTAVTQSIKVIGNHVTSTRGSDAIYIGTTVTSAAVTQTVLAVNANTIASAAGNGIHIHNSAGPGGILSQGSSTNPATIDDNVITYLGNSGIFVSNAVFFTSARVTNWVYNSYLATPTWNALAVG